LNVPSHLLSDLRGVSRLAFDATAGLVRLVETVHRTVQTRPGPLGPAPVDRPNGVTGLVYRGIEGTTRAMARGLDAVFEPVAAALPRGESSPGRDAVLAALNGVHGDYLTRTGNPLAIDMSLRYAGQPLDPTDPGSALAASSSDRILVLAHGLCMTDWQWASGGHDHGQALATDAGYTPLYLRYNSGLPVSRNGRQLAELLETLLASWPRPVAELAIIGHSMGGLVARAAHAKALELGYDWPRRLKRLAFLGTPHHGAPLERGGHLFDRAVELSPYSAPFARLGKLRSAGIVDLRHGGIVDDDGELVPLPADVDCYTMAGVLGSQSGLVAERLVGDGIVPLDSALGRHADPDRTLDFPEGHQWVGFRLSHLSLLRRRDVYDQLLAWLG